MWMDDMELSMTARLGVPSSDRSLVSSASLPSSSLSGWSDGSSEWADNSSRSQVGTWECYGDGE